VKSEGPWGEGSWSAIHDQEFTDLKRALMDPPVMAYPDLDKPFILETD